MRKLLDGSSLIVFGLVSVALGLIIGGAFSGHPIRGLILLKASPRFWYYAFVIHSLGLWITSATGVVVLLRTLCRRHPILARVFDGRQKSIAWVAVAVIAFLWPFVALEQLRDDTVIKHESEVRELQCAVAFMFVNNESSEAMRRLREYDAYFHREFNGSQNRITRVDPATVKAAQILTKMPPFEALRMPVEPEVHSWILSCSDH